MSKNFSPLQISIEKVEDVLQQAKEILHVENLTRSVDQRFLVIDHRQLAEGDIFLAMPGKNFDPHNNLSEILQKKPTLCILESGEQWPKGAYQSAYLVVKNSRRAWALLASAAYNDPGKDLIFIGVTGTNGKTSTVWHLHHILNALGHPNLSIGTLGFWLHDEYFPTTHTTPDPPVFYEILSKARERQIKYVVMEVSSHSISQEKLAAIKFDACVFTSFTRDHLDFHADMEDYFSAKMRLFSQLAKPNAKFIICDRLEDRLKEFAGFNPVIVYGSSDGKWVKKYGFNDFRKLAPEVFRPQILGDFAQENLFAAVQTIACSLGLEPDEVLKRYDIRQVPGRLELVSGRTLKAPKVVVDYAHTPDALEKALMSLRPECKAGKLTVVFGCGGNRDKGKRSQMGSLAVGLADQIIVTSDNSRDEDPEQIISDIVSGNENDKKIHRMTDRKIAMEFAIKNAGENDVILIAGKGAEEYMEVSGKKIPFDDRVIAKQILEGLA